MSLFGKTGFPWVQSDKGATECFTTLWMTHLTETACGSMSKRWPWVEPDADPEFIAFMAKYGVEIPIRTLEQRLIPMEDA